MNPLSSHPPRTPRASLISAHSHVYGTNIYDTTEQQDEKPYQAEEELDQEDTKVKELGRRVRREDVWREMLLTSVGRDKAFVRGFLWISLATILTYVPTEIAAIWHQSLSLFPLIIDDQFALEEASPSSLGEGAR